MLVSDAMYKATDQRDTLTPGCVPVPGGTKVELKTKASDAPLAIKLSPDLDPSLDAVEVLLMCAPCAEAVKDAKSSL
jgi:hypothetical protein